MFHGLLTCDGIARGSMVVTSKVLVRFESPPDLLASAKRSGIQRPNASKDGGYLHLSNGRGQAGYAHSRDPSLHHRDAACHGVVSHQSIPQNRVMKQSEISNGRVSYFTIGGTFPFTADGFNPLTGVAKRDRASVDMSKFSFSFIKLMRVCVLLSFSCRSLRMSV